MHIGAAALRRAAGALAAAAALSLGGCFSEDDRTGPSEGTVSLRAENLSTEPLLMGERSLTRVEPGESARVLEFDVRLATRTFLVKSAAGVLVYEIDARAHRAPDGGSCASTLRIIKRPGERFFHTAHDERCTVEIVSVRQY